MKIKNKKYNLKGNINVNIILISDIHYYSKKDIKHLEKILNNIKDINPNFICIPGDLIDESNIKDEKYLINWLKKLSNISKVILTLGNHELYYDKSKNIYKLNRKLLNKIKQIDNLYLLDNKNVIIDNVNFIGLSLSIDEYINNKDIDINKILTNKKYYNILLSHSPINLFSNQKLLNKNIDLILCGHMHGGLVPLFLRDIMKHRGFVSPNKKILPKNSYGYFSLGNTDLIITSGITMISHMNKFSILKKLFYSEIVEISISKK